MAYKEWLAGWTNKVLAVGRVAYGGDGTDLYPFNADADGQKVGHNISGIGDGVTLCGTAGTDVVLASSTAAKSIILQAQTDNTGAVAIGATGVDATVATGTGLLLYAGDWTPTLEIDNLADIYIDATVSGQGVRYIYFT